MSVEGYFVYGRSGEVYVCCLEAIGVFWGSGIGIAVRLGRVAVLGIIFIGDCWFR